MSTFQVPDPTKGRILVGDGSAWTSLAVGSASAVLSADAAASVGAAWLDRADFGFPAPLSGRYVDVSRYWHPYGRTTGAAVTADTLYAWVVWMRKGESIAGVSFYQSTAGAASTAARCGIYAYAPSTGMAGALLIDAGTVATDGANGDKDCTSNLPYVIPSTGLYVAAAVFSGTPAVIRINVSTTFSLIGQTSLINTAATTPGFSRAFTYAALPDPFGGSPAFYSLSTQVPNIGFKLS